MKLFTNILFQLILVILIDTHTNQAKQHNLQKTTTQIHRKVLFKIRSKEDSDEIIDVENISESRYKHKMGNSSSIIKKRKNSATKTRPKFARVKKNSLNRNFFNTIGVRNNCTHQVCFPPIGNLLIGRRNFLYANSTCGNENAERFCILGDAYASPHVDSLFTLYENEVQKTSKCLVCDSREPYSRNINSHRIENVINTRKQTNEEMVTKWWQSENGIENVFIQFDLESEFILAHIYMVFKSFPPAAMIFEKSSDYGVSWQPIAYFASNCEELFPGVPQRSEYLNTPICVSKYSQQNAPTRELIYRPLYRYRYLDPYLLTKHLKITNLRFNLTKQHMLGDNFMANNEDVFLKYYYAIKEIQIIGTCFCNGHSSHCEQDTDVHYDSDCINRMIHSKCVCQHNTYGHNCQKCLPLYNNKQWKPAEYGEANECELCECNDHAESCIFDEKLFIANGGRDGGVCACMHNTEGVNCEKCIKNYYHDKSLPFKHPKACKPCKCNAIGTITTTNDTICMDKNCKCKLYVTGENCDTCLDGYWNLSIENGDYGCQKCDCKVEGTLENLGCNKKTGKCFDCKENVEGPACEKCKLGYYGLSRMEKGCYSCDCAIGFSYSDECNQETGECSCKPNFYGKKCDIIGEGFYCAKIDHLIHEAEDAIEINNLSQISEKYDGNESTESPRWTGIGYLKVFEGAHLKFKFSHNHDTGLFDLVIRYDVENDWDNVIVQIVNMGADKFKSMNRLYSKFCSDLKPSQNRIEEIKIEFDKYKTASFIYSSYCFEKNSIYEVNVLFSSMPKRRSRSIYNSAKEMPTILIDSLVIIPDIKHLINTTKNQPLQEKYREASNCLVGYLNLPSRKSTKCDSAFCIVTSEYFGLMPCECDTMGSFSNNCAQKGGECLCKPNVIGRKCNKCKQTTWGFSSKGCQSCNCDFGSKNNLCDVKTGQCDCYDNRYGKTCSECSPGYYGPPYCHKCQCNGLSDTCSSTGVCNDCRSNSEGANCERCQQGFYGSPILGIPCKPCACPGANGNNFATNCVLNEVTGKFKCQCQKGYTGERCDKCETFYYGNPLQVQGRCRKCNCNDNVDRSDPNSCDPVNGQCNNCLYNTHGFNCEKCKIGYYGNALIHDCKKCECNPYGTDMNSVDSCDSSFGHCKCLPNVIGKLCDECAENFWNLDDGKGCIQCDCDITGTRENTTYCNQKTGQCNCVKDRGGRTCRDCPFGFWGSPKKGCNKCMCNIQGSVSAQCDKYDGHCACLSGITGYHCDQCSRGTSGKAPSCIKCGECFDNWDDTLEKRAINIYASLGVNLTSTNLSDFYTQYDKISQRINDIELIISLNKSDRGLPRLNDRLDLIKSRIQQFSSYFENAKNRIEKWTLNDTIINEHRHNYNILNNQTIHLLKVSISLSESFVNGAQLSIKLSINTSEEALEIIERTNRLIETSYKKRLKELKQKLNSTMQKLEINSEVFMEPNRKNKIDEDNSNFEESLAQLDSLVCGGPPMVNPNCSSKCGSSKCGKCGYFDQSLENYESQKYEIAEENKECSDGLEFSYLRFVDMANYFKTFYEQKEASLKNELNKLNVEKITKKKIHDETKMLEKKVNLTLTSLYTQSNIINSLISTAFNFSDKYISQRQQIEASCAIQIDSLNSSYIEDKNKELEMKINLIKSLSNELKEAIQFEKANTTELNDTIESYFNITAFDKIPEYQFQNISNFTNEVQVLVDKNDQYLRNISQQNTEISSNQLNINKTLDEVKLNLFKLSNKENLYQEVVNIGQTYVNFDQNKNHYDSLQYKINEIKTHILNTNSKLKLLSDELEKVMGNIGDEKNEDSTVFLLIQLKEKILKSEKNLKEKLAKLKDYQEKNINLNKSIEVLKNELESLKLTTRHINSELTNKSTFSKSCQ